MGLVTTLVVGAVPAAAAPAGTWTNTGPLTGTDCSTSWTGEASYTLPSTSIFEIDLAAGGLANCSVTLRGTDLSTWQVSLDSGVTWTTLAGTYEGFSAGGGPTAIWFRVGETSATIGSGNYAVDYGSNFQESVISIQPILPKGDAELTFWLPDGRECSTISPVSVPIDSAYVLPQPGADCKTTAGSTIVGWKVGWDDLIHPPGHTVLVVDSQQFTAIVQEEVFTVTFDANVAAEDACLTGEDVVSPDARSVTVEIDRADLADYRIMTAPVCIPPGHYFAGWRSAPGEPVIELGGHAPAEWASTTANAESLYARWLPAPPVMPAFGSQVIPLNPVHVLVGDVTFNPSFGTNVTQIGASEVDVAIASGSDAARQGIDDFFANGGDQLTIVSSGGADADSLAAAVRSIETAGTLDIVAPDLRTLSSEDWIVVASAMTTYADSIHAMAWIDPPADALVGSVEDAISAVTALATQLRNSVGASALAGTLLSAGVVGADGLARAAGPGVVGMRSLTDVEEGIWNGLGADSGLVGVTSETPTTQEEMSQLIESGVTPVVDWPTGKTIAAMPRTLVQSNFTVNVRFVDWLRQTLLAGTTPYVFAPNDATTWSLMTSALSQFLTNLWDEGGLVGTTASDSFSAVCSSVPDEILNGYASCTVDVAVGQGGSRVTIFWQQQMMGAGLSTPPPAQYPGVYVEQV